jgi:hypothetical protein
MAEKKRQDNGGAIFALIVMVLAVFSMAVLSPGIIAASIARFLFGELGIGPLWGTALSVSLLVLGACYRKYGEDDYWKNYLGLSFSLFIIGGLFCLFTSGNNALLQTVKLMYPFMPL